MPGLAMIRGLLLLMAVALAGVALTLGYIAALALRRGEGVFLPAAYVGALCGVGAVLLYRYATGAQ